MQCFYLAIHVALYTGVELCTILERSMIRQPVHVQQFLRLVYNSGRSRILMIGEEGGWLQIFLLEILPTNALEASGVIFQNVSSENFEISSFK